MKKPREQSGTVKTTILTVALPNLLVRLWHHLSRRRRRQFGLLMGLMLVSAFAEVVSLGAVLPFLGILVAPDRVFNHPIVADVAQAWGIASADQLVLSLTVAFVAAALIAGAIRILLLWVSTRIAFASGADLGIEVYRRTLYQPYRVHLARNSSEVISGITNKVNGVVFGVLFPLLTLVSSTVLLVAIMLALIAHRLRILLKAVRKDTKPMWGSAASVSPAASVNASASPARFRAQPQLPQNGQGDMKKLRKQCEPGPFKTRGVLIPAPLQNLRCTIFPLPWRLT